MAKKKGESRVKIYLDWCKGCGICAAFCPTKTLKISPKGKAEVVNEEECINCGFCEVHCPDFAIMVYPKNQDANNCGADAGQFAAGEDESAKPEAVPTPDNPQPAASQG
ncbi:4Fe-4S dicluster domain-containing protein [Desulfonatronovibrio magnus]|uniref:4Fe-4S dicluster domain-containing protein n=1 Tax=Desulfonatronovibrio magnus TaxID=698827 RepID=UPI0005EBF05C|nr:4Fe-4S binding protein [Desulfonatronovibrio magnus]